VERSVSQDPDDYPLLVSHTWSPVQAGKVRVGERLLSVQIESAPTTSAGWDKVSRRRILLVCVSYTVRQSQDRGWYLT
jgi:hypothetical protein